ncbi:transposase [Streptomyces sp. NPDC087851]|uniref:transposase n=1 Tax=Streptomyces sp. NPDC087851 TaxID=3365810 RepID=UPI00381089DC
MTATRPTRAGTPTRPPRRRRLRCTAQLCRPQLREGVHPPRAGPREQARRVLMTYRIRKRKRWREFLGLLKSLRARWPGEKLYVVLDNFSPHNHVDVRTWTADNDVELVFLPTYGSWPNWIEAEFAALRYFALNGTDHRTHAE